MFAPEDILSYFPISNPTWIFFIVLCIILFAPLLFGKLRIPHIIGMILAGVAIGPFGGNILEADSSFEIFGKVGLYYILFLAGLEMDVNGFRRNKVKGAIFGFCTFTIPFISGFAVGYWGIGFSIAASLLLASILASHTLVTYPTVSRYGLNHAPSVTISIGATMMALIASLIVLAGISSTFEDEQGASFWLLFPTKVIAFIVAILYLYPRWVRWFFRKYSDNVTQYVFVMSLVFMAAAIGEFIGLEGIFGAFLTGLVINRHIPSNSSLMTRIEFVGNALFIPYFLISVGMMINLSLLFKGTNTIIIVLAMVLVGTISKYLAARLTAKLCHMNRYEHRMLFGLTEAHAAGALAMVMVGTRLEVAPGQHLISDDVLNGVVIMILCSCIISSFVTESASRKLAIGHSDNDEKNKGDDEKIIIPIHKESNMNVLVETALMMRNPNLNRGLIGLNVVLDDEKVEEAKSNGVKLLKKAENIVVASDVRMQTQSRIATNIANGILHALRENNSSEMIMGLHAANQEMSNPSNFIHDIIYGTHRQIAMLRFTMPISTMRRIHVLVPRKAEFEHGFHRWLTRILRMATQLDSRVVFYSTTETRVMIQSFAMNNFPLTRTSYELSTSMIGDIIDFNDVYKEDHMLVVVLARRGTLSYTPDFEKIALMLARGFTNHNLMVLYPDQYGHPEQRRAIRI